MTAALLFKDQEISAVELERRAAGGAQGFDRLGVAEGDVVALMLYNEPAYLEAMLACRRLGAYHCPINWHYKADEAGYILRDTGFAGYGCAKAHQGNSSAAARMRNQLIGIS